jgi:hypothetical protein
MMIGLPCFVVPETANVRLGSALLFDFNCHNLDLVVCKADLNLKHCWHNEFISLDRIEIMFLLLLGAWYMHLILLPISIITINLLTSAYTVIIAAVAYTSPPLTVACIPHRSSLAIASSKSDHHLVNPLPPSAIAAPLLQLPLVTFRFHPCHRP